MIIGIILKAFEGCLSCVHESQSYIGEEVILHCMIVHL